MPSYSSFTCSACADLQPRFAGLINEPFFELTPTPFFSSFFLMEFLEQNAGHFYGFTAAIEKVLLTAVACKTRYDNTICQSDCLPLYSLLFLSFRSSLSLYPCLLVSCQVCVCNLYGAKQHAMCLKDAAGHQYLPFSLSLSPSLSVSVSPQVMHNWLPLRSGA